MELLVNYSTPFVPENRKASPSIQVLQIHKNSLTEDQEDDLLPEGISVCHAPLAQTLREAWINDKQINAVIVGSECYTSDIVAIREITTRKAVPLILHTLKFEWKAKEIALESGVDEYHVGFLGEQFIKRIKLIRRIKLLDAVPGKLQRAESSPAARFWLLKRCFDIAISVLFILLLLPILSVIVPLLMFNMKGPILSSSKRVGKNYKVFNLYKFKHFSSGHYKKSQGVWKFFSKVHLTGLPQILNVIKGDMSFVGNYPITAQDAEKFTKDEIAWRFSVPAGIVGLWRFNGGENRISALDCIMQDMEYAMANSIWLDIRILCFHLLNLLDREGKAWMLQNTTLEKSIPNYVSKEKVLNVATNF